MALLVVSGGSTPLRYFEALSSEDARLVARRVTLADERRVPDDSPRSNARLVRGALLGNLRGEGAPSRRSPNSRLTPEQELAAAARASPACRCRPISSCSAWATTATPHRGFPHADGLAEAMDSAARALVAPISAPGAPEPRLTLTGRVILRARKLALQIEGANKFATLARALADGPVEDMPIRAALRQAADRLTIFSAPNS